MPKRKVRDSLLLPDVEAAALAAICEALKHPHILSAEEEREFQRHRAALPIVDESGTWADDSAWCITRRHAFFIDMRPSDSGKPVDPKYKTLVMRRRGRIVYREHGKAGADLSVPPYYWHMLQRRRDFEAEAAKVERQLAARWLYQSRQRKAEVLARSIVELSKTITGTSRLKRIASEAGCSISTVKRVLAANKKGSQRR